MRRHRLEGSGNTRGTADADGGGIPESAPPAVASRVSAWVKRLADLAPLDTGERRLLEDSIAQSREYATADPVIRNGDPCDRMLVVLDGLAAEFKLLADGRRQILSYLLPGDMTDPRALLMPCWNHSICALWPSRIATLGADAVRRLECQPNIGTAMARYSVIKQAISREWLLNVGNRTAFERLGYLLCETFARLKTVGLTTGDSFELPLTQAELADTLALSAVHVNRTLMELRRLRLITFQSRQATIHDHATLCAAVGFDAAYLHA